MSNRVSYSTRIPSYGGEGSHFFVMWLMKFKSWLALQNLSEILEPTFKDSLPDTEVAILNENRADDKKKIRALRLNAKGTRAPIIALETPGMMNMSCWNNQETWNGQMAFSQTCGMLL